MASHLGLSSDEIAEIGGFSETFARDLLAGLRLFPEDVRLALLDIQDDIDVIADHLVARAEEGEAAICMFRTNQQLRDQTNIPGRGQAAGGFLGPYRIAALTAWDSLQQAGIEVQLLFVEEG